MSEGDMTIDEIMEFVIKLGRENLVAGILARAARSAAILSAAGDAAAFGTGAIHVGADGTITHVPAQDLLAQEEPTSP